VSWESGRSRPPSGPLHGSRCGSLAGGALTFCALACAEPSAPAHLGELERRPGAVVELARVEDERVALVTVERIVAAQQIPFDEGMRLAIFDALCAREARARDLDRVSSFEIATHLARGVLDDELERARDLGPPSADELRAFTAEHRLEVARPEVVVVVHALLRLSAEATPAEVASVQRRADALAVRLREAARPLAGSTAPNYTPRPGLTLTRLPKDPALTALEAAAREVDGSSVIFEQLAPFARDGNTVVDDTPFALDTTFTASAFGLTRRGDVTGPIRSPFGLHVIVLLDRIAGQELTEDELLRSASTSIYGARARRALDRTLAELRANTPIDLDPAVDEALGRVDVKGPQ
jgi:hypothetical protein